MRYAFDDYILDTQRYELHRADKRVPLRPKPFEVLAYLLAHRDRIVPKDELLEHLWAGQFVGDATLNTCIKEVRRAIGDRGAVPRLLRTVRGRGYRFVAPVEERPDTQAGTMGGSPQPRRDTMVSPPRRPTRWRQSRLRRGRWQNLTAARRWTPQPRRGF